jgi:ribosomal protein RSM22 (predicted rRNA methylase)
MIATLPDQLSQAIAKENAGFSPVQIHQAAEKLSLAYRGRAHIRPELSPAGRAAYLAVRFPSTFAAANHVWSEFDAAIPTDGIKSVLDVGAGPGTASLAAAPYLGAAAFTYVERDAGWREPAQRLAQSLGLKHAFIRGEIGHPTKLAPHDVVIASYAIGELPPDERKSALEALWTNARQALIVIEPGTPKGFDVVVTVRALALSSGGHAAAPCTHNAACPMSTADWCHRPVRVARSAAHRAAKGADLAYEDEKFAYAVLTRLAPRRRSESRIVRKPIRNAGHVHLDLCSTSGLARQTVARSDGALYRAARDAAWGDLWPPHED